MASSGDGGGAQIGANGARPTGGAAFLVPCTPGKGVAGARAEVEPLKDIELSGPSDAPLLLRQSTLNLFPGLTGDDEGGAMASPPIISRKHSLMDPLARRKSIGDALATSLSRSNSVAEMDSVSASMFDDDDDDEDGGGGGRGGDGREDAGMATTSPGDSTDNQLQGEAQAVPHKARTIRSFAVTTNAVPSDEEDDEDDEDDEENNEKRDETEDANGEEAAAEEKMAALSKRKSGEFDAAAEGQENEEGEGDENEGDAATRDGLGPQLERPAKVSRRESWKDSSELTDSWRVF